MRGCEATGFAHIRTMMLCRPAVCEDFLDAVGKLKGQSRSVRLRVKTGWRCQTGIHQQNGLASFQALKAGKIGVEHGGNLRLVIGEQGGHNFRRGDAHAVKQGQRAIRMAEHPQHRHDAVERILQIVRGGQPARHKDLPQRQKVESQINQGLWIAAEVAAITQHLQV